MPCARPKPWILCAHWCQGSRAHPCLRFSLYEEEAEELGLNIGLPLFAFLICFSISVYNKLKIQEFSLKADRRFYLYFINFSQC